MFFASRESNVQDPYILSTQAASGEKSSPNTSHANLATQLESVWGPSHLPHPLSCTGKLSKANEPLFRSTVKVTLCCGRPAGC